MSRVDRLRGYWDRLQLVLIVLVWPRVIAPLVLTITDTALSSVE